MALSIVTQSTFEPISLKEAKDRLRITSEQEDDQILGMIRGATKWAEHQLHWKLCTQTWKYYLDTWPNYSYEGDEPTIIRVPYPPLQSVTHVKYYNGSNVLTTLTENTDYWVDTVSYPGRIRPINGWPSLYSRMNPIEIQFVCGFDSADDIDEDIKDAIYLRLADLYEYRQDSIIGTVNKNTETAESLLMNHKLYNEPCR